LAARALSLLGSCFGLFSRGNARLAAHILNLIVLVPIALLLVVLLSGALEPKLLR
jgi:hypothetical protein